MEKRLKFILIILSFIGLILIAGTVKFIIDAPLRNKIPVHPDFGIISEPLQEQIEEASSKAKFYPSSDNLGRLGMVYHSCANYEKAAQCYRLAIERNSKKWIWSYYLGHLSLEQGESEASIENFSNVLNKNSQNFLALYYMGQAYQKLGSTGNAKRMFTQIVNNPDYNAEVKNTRRNNFYPLKTYAMFQLSRIYLNSNLIDSAEVSLKKIIEDQMTYGSAYRLLGNVYTLKGDSILANKYIVRANDQSDFTPPPADNLIDSIAMISRSDIYLLKKIDDAERSNNFQLSLKLCNQAMKFFPDNKYLISKAIVEYLRNGLDKLALSYLDLHFKYYSDDYNELIDVTEMLYDRGHTKEALKYFDQLIKLKPENSGLALWLFDRGMTEKAKILINDQLENYPENINILTDVVNLLLRMGHDDLATKYLTKLNQLEPTSINAKIITGTMAEKQGKLDNALIIYEEVFKLKPKDFIFIDYLTNLLVGQKMWEQAISHCKTALEIFPNNPILLERLGKLLIACPDSKYLNISEGIEYSERAFNNFKSGYQTRLDAGRNLSIAFASSGDKKNALKYIDLTIALAKERNMDQKYVSYFNSLKKLYKI